MDLLRVGVLVLAVLVLVVVLFILVKSVWTFFVACMKEGEYGLRDFLAEAVEVWGSFRLLLISAGVTVLVLIILYLGFLQA